MIEEYGKFLREVRGFAQSMIAQHRFTVIEFLTGTVEPTQPVSTLSVDAFSRLSPAIDVRAHYRGPDVVDTLERVTGIHGTPKTIRLDNGPEFISKALDLWAWLNGVTLDFSRPGKPTDNAFIESFNGSFRAECLNACWFLSLADAASAHQHSTWTGTGGRSTQSDLLIRDRQRINCRAAR